MPITTTTTVSFATLVVLAGLAAVYQYQPASERAPMVRSGGCQNFDGENACKGQQTENPTEWANRNF